jgi:uncharacterized membrane protein YqjE
VNVLQLLRGVAGALLDQASLHGELLGVEWAQEKNRIRSMVTAMLLGFACLLGLLAALSLLVLSLYWDTPYRVAAIVGLAALYAVGMTLAWRRLRSQAELGTRSFAASRSELAADVQLLRSQI